MMSCSSGFCGRIAQLVEHRPYKARATGSSPVPPTSCFPFGVVVKPGYNAGLSRRRPRVQFPSTPPSIMKRPPGERPPGGLLLFLLPALKILFPRAHNCPGENQTGPERHRKRKCCLFLQFWKYSSSLLPAVAPPGKVFLLQERAVRRRNSPCTPLCRASPCPIRK